MDVIVALLQVLSSPANDALNQLYCHWRTRICMKGSCVYSLPLVN